VNAFHVIGGLTALWAVVVSFLGITREGFPNSKLAERLVALVSIVLVAGSITSAVVTGAIESREGEQHGRDEARLLPR
jgi:hypothetical protein